MINDILQSVLELQGFIILSAAMAVLSAFGILFWLEREKSGMGAFGIQALFLKRTPFELAFLALGLLELVFAASGILWPSRMGREQLVLLAMLCLFRSITGLSLEGLAAEAAYGVLTAGALTAGSMLHAYMAETGFDAYVMCARILLSVFLVQYSLYHLIKGVERMLRRNEKMGKKKA